MPNFAESDKMNVEEYLPYFLKVREKIEQVLRLQLKLEESAQPVILTLQNSNDSSSILERANSLQNILKRKLRIIGYCEEGVLSAKKVFEDFEREVKRKQGFVSRIKSKIPILKNNFEAQFARMEFLAFTEMKWQIAYASNNSAKLKNLVGEQDKTIGLIIQKAESGNMAEYAEIFEAFLLLRLEERELLEGIKRTNNAEKLNKAFSTIMNSLQKVETIAENNIMLRVLKNSLKNHPRLAAIQAAWVPVPDVTIGSTFVAYYFGAVYLPPFVVICYIVEWLPAITALGIEMAKEARKKRKK